MVKQKEHTQTKGKRPEERQTPADADESCRCKQTADMKPGELLRLMISDLAFWKKSKQ